MYNQYYAIGLLIQQQLGGITMNQHKTLTRYLREPQVFEITQLSKSTRWRLERDGKFPRRRQLSSNSVA